MQQALDGGADAVLVREKDLTSARLLALASRLREITRRHHVQLIIHTQADIARAVDADGVHLAGADIETIPAVRQWLADPDKSVSVSCHSADELGQASRYGADFAMLSPVFATASHPGAPHLGVDAFDALASQAQLPVVALGGITVENCAALKAKYMAVIGALLGAENPKHAAQQLLGAAG